MTRPAHISVVVLNSALKCLASVVDDEVEEAALDAQFYAAGGGFRANPSLATAIRYGHYCNNKNTLLSFIPILEVSIYEQFLRYFYSQIYSDLDK